MIMIIKIRKVLKKILTTYILPQMQLSYSQFGEDLIMHFFFRQHGIEHPTYLDIGANEPRFLSNTFYFYQRNAKGILIEPNPYLIKKIRSQRPRDIVINTGVGVSEEHEADYYIFPNHENGFNTFSKKDAMHWENVGEKSRGKIKVKEVIKMSIVHVNSILEKYFPEKAPDFISLDVEGLDLEILKSMDFDKYRPKLICVETMRYDENQNHYKTNEITEFMIGKNYFVYGDTYVNTIYCKNDL